MVRFRAGKVALSSDISMAYNGTRLVPEHMKFQKYLWRDSLQAKEKVKTMYVCTLIYGVKPSGQQTQVTLEKLAEHFVAKNECLEGAVVLKKNVYVDDIMSAHDSFEKLQEISEDIVKILARGTMGVKAFSFSKRKPEEIVSADGVHVGLGGYLWATEEDLIKLDIGPPRLGKAKRGKHPEPITGSFVDALKPNFTRRILTGLVAGVFDPLGLVTPFTAGLKLDLHHLCSLKLDWDDPVPIELLEKWGENMDRIQQLKTVTFNRTVIPEDAANTEIELLVLCDASQNLGIVAIFARVLRKNGTYSCQLMLGRSKLLVGLTIPKAEMKAAVCAAVTASVVKRNLGERFSGVTFCTDSTVVLYWISQDDRSLQVGVRNAVAEVRRLSKVSAWFDILTHLNVADLGTRVAVVDEILPGSSWQVGQSWMELPRSEMPLKTAAEITLTSEEKRLAALETRNADIQGHSVNFPSSELETRYAFSKYILDPCRLSWSKTRKVLALVFWFISLCRKQKIYNQTLGTPLEPVTPTSQEYEKADSYLFSKATCEVKKFAAPNDYKNCSIEKKGILYFNGRLLGTEEVLSLEKTMYDLNPTSFCKPIVEKNSPIAFSILIETHWSLHHSSPAATYRESLGTAYIIGGRALAQLIRNECPFCKRYRAKKLNLEMGKIHQNRLVVAPPFTFC